MHLSPAESQAILALTPKAIDWVQACSADLLKNGSTLSLAGMEMARSVGVSAPENIRVAFVPSLPLPDDPELRAAALALGLLGPDMVGLTVGYGIYLCHGHANARLFSHECRHVHQFEQAGSTATFITQYLEQVAAFGYMNAPFEIDARAHEHLG
jgi:hypothetical protein